MLASVITAKSQSWEVGGWLGVSNYFGDLNTATDFRTVFPAGGVILKRNYNPNWSLKYTISGSRLSFKDKYSPYVYQKARNLDFSSLIIEASIQMEFNFFEYITGDPDRFFSPYLTGGLAIFYFQPRAKFVGGTFKNLRPLGTEGQSYARSAYSPVSVSIPFGIGIKQIVGKHLNFGIEVTNHRTFTDYLDDLSNLYPDKNQLSSNNGVIAPLFSDKSDPSQIGITGKQRGNSQNNDSYLFVGISLTYTFKGDGCYY